MEQPASWPPPHPVLDAPYGPRYAAPPPPPEPHPQGRRAGWDLTPMEPTPRSRRWTVLFVAICTAVAVVGGVLAYRFVSNERFPAAWDARVGPLASFVERTTSLRFSHAVTVRFLPDAEFDKLVSTDETDVSDSDRKRLADEVAVGRAFGWFSGDTDLLKEQNQLQTSGILALYSFDRREVVARTNTPASSTLSPALRSTIVHELVHVIQDQRLGIRRIKSRASDDSAQQAVLALLEGHAVHIERKYIDSLPADDRAAFDDETGGMIDEVQADTKDVPRVLSAALEAPYVVGPALVAAADADRGGIDQLFVRPPVALDQVVDPRAYFANDTPEKLADPTVTGSPLPSETAGIVRLYLTLAAALPPERAWQAALAWGNDVYVPFREKAEGTVCVRWDIASDTPQGATELRAALQEWASSRPTQARVTVSTGTAPITVSMCDPGTAVTQTLVAQSVVEALYLRVGLLTEIIPEVPSLDIAYCATDAILEQIPAGDLQEPDDTVRTRARRIIDGCIAAAPAKGG